MTLHKIVNGEKVELTAEEEKATLIEWEKNKIEVQKRLEEQRLLEAKKEEVKLKLAETLGMTPEDVSLLIR